MIAGAVGGGGGGGGGAGGGGAEAAAVNAGSTRILESILWWLIDARARGGRRSQIWLSATGIRFLLSSSLVARQLLERRQTARDERRRRSNNKIGEILRGKLGKAKNLVTKLHAC